jgi:Skp family chaperone for outer membrane proteins
MRVLRRASAALAFACIAQAVEAQTGAPPVKPAPGIPGYGAPIATLCLFARSEALDKSQAGLSANQQIEQFTQGLQAQLSAERTAIINDDKQLATLKNTLAAAEYQQRVTQMRQRYDALARTTQIQAAQLAKTRGAALQLVTAAMNPALADTITARHCSVVFERAGTYGANPAMDVTAEVIKLMNMRLPLITLKLAPPDSAPPPN